MLYVSVHMELYNLSLMIVTLTVFLSIYFSCTSRYYYRLRIRFRNIITKMHKLCLYFYLYIDSDCIPTDSYTYRHTCIYPLYVYTIYCNSMIQHLTSEWCKRDECKNQYELVNCQTLK